MSLKNRAKATVKNLEGKVQEAVGDLTGDKKAQAEGQEKQAEAQVLQVVEDVKDEAHKMDAKIRHASENVKHEALQAAEDVKHEARKTAENAKHEARKTAEDTKAAIDHVTH